MKPGDLVAMHVESATLNVFSEMKSPYIVSDTLRFHDVNKVLS